MAHTNTWNSAYEASPADGDDVADGAGKVRGLKVDIKERFALEHQYIGDNNDGRLKIDNVTTATRDGYTGADLWTGRFIYNTTNTDFEMYNGSVWVPAGSTVFCRLDFEDLTIADSTDVYLNNGDLNTTLDAGTLWITGSDHLKVPTGYTRVQIIFTAIVQATNTPEFTIFITKNGEGGYGGPSAPQINYSSHTSGTINASGNNISGCSLVIDDTAIGGTDYYTFGFRQENSTSASKDAVGCITARVWV